MDALRRLIGLCDDLRSLRRRIADPNLRREARARLRRESMRKVQALTRDLGSYRFRGPVGHLLRECKLSAEHFQILAMLLHRHLCDDQPACEGRLVLAAVFDSAFEVLSGTRLLEPTSPLRSAGLVVLEDDDDHAWDVLDARFRLADSTLDAFRAEVVGAVPNDRQRGPASYGNNRDFLVDLRILHNLYQLRAERVFNQDRWNRVHDINRDPALGVSRRIESCWRRIRTRLDATEGAADFPVVRFMTEHALATEETIIVVHLLFKELYEGNAYADAAELLKLVSESDADLIRNRRLVMPGGTLVAAEILQLEPMIESRELTSEVHLQDWAVNYLLGTPAPERSINSDERLDWHLYLKNLNDAHTFFRDLDAN